MRRFGHALSRPLLALGFTAVMAFAFPLVQQARAADTETVLYTFTGGLDGGFPSAVIFDPAGNLYGATQIGGTVGQGTVFELTPVSGGWSLNTLYNFGTRSNDGSEGVGALIFDAAGNLYGTTYLGGGSANCAGGCGTVFELSPGVNGWTEKILHAFTGRDGDNPASQLTFDGASNLYGTTRLGGASGFGVVFQLSPMSGGRWKETVIHSFSSTEGGDPVHAGVVIDPSGNLYGTSFNGGVYKLALVAGRWKETILHKFAIGSGIGGFPEAGVTLDSAGNLYGSTTQSGGPGSAGGVFELKPAAGGKYTYQILRTFTAAPDGAFPSTGVVFDNSGSLFGSTNAGGSSDSGSVYQLTPTSRGQWRETQLYGFTGGSDGLNPNTTPLTLDANGNVYGSTNGGGVGLGVVFEVMP